MFQLDTAKRLSSKIVIKREKADISTQTKGDVIMNNMKREFNEKFSKIHTQLKETEKAKFGKEIINIFSTRKAKYCAYWWAIKNF